LQSGKIILKTILFNILQRLPFGTWSTHNTLLIVICPLGKDCSKGNRQL
jgi:hypothetical protein